MKDLLYRIFLKNWPRKLVALATAIIVWFLVSQTITVSRTLSNIPVRIINLPKNKTVLGLLPNGYMKYRISISVTGVRSAVEDLVPNDLEIVINAEGEKESWVAPVTKKNLSNLYEESPDWKKDISSVTTNDLFMKMSNLVTEEIPLTINRPFGDPPKGYQYLDIWPKYLTQKVTGPEEQMKTLKQRGLEVTYNLSHVTQHELDTLAAQSKTDEISFFIPSAWKMVAIPFKGNTLEPFNDPRSKLLRIDFLKQELMPLGVELPITIFFPVKYSRTINPQTYSLNTNDFIQKKNGLKVLTKPLYVKDVSRLFLDCVRDNLLLTIVAEPKSVKRNLDWGVQFVDPTGLENRYVMATLKEMEEVYKDEHESFTKYSEQTIRERFRDYIRAFHLYEEKGTPLNLVGEIDANTISLEEP
ncbi:MAG: hypothetical protein S4CHLAM81_09770 [Chlamydiales bacterium]|nr:hypothetical protein [Chlamydiales bacterium]MCH9635755.1 hypothetical protein [Chlamydiales bacterium]MCH9703211.1 hypothetical protein [Chlamydiota bacterium]